MAGHSWDTQRTSWFGDVPVPYINVALRRADGRFQKLALQLDTGAVISLLRRSVADRLGIELESGRRVDLGAIGGARIVTWQHSILTRFGPELELYAIYAIAEREDVPNLLGRAGILDRLVITLDGRARATHVERIHG